MHQADHRGPGGVVDLLGQAAQLSRLAHANGHSQYPGGHVDYTGHHRAAPGEYHPRGQILPLAGLLEAFEHAFENLFEPGLHDIGYQALANQARRATPHALYLDLRIRVDQQRVRAAVSLLESLCFAQ